MPAIKWTPLSEHTVEPEREYTALITYLPLTTYFMIPKFLYLTGEIRKQLAESEGVLGYSLIAEILKKEFWTMSVWENEDTLNRFVRTGAHLKTMRELSRYLSDERKFVKATVKGREVPPGWEWAREYVIREGQGAA